MRGYSEPTMGSDLVCGSPVSPRRLVVQWFTPPDRLEGAGRGGAGAPGGCGRAAEGVCAGSNWAKGMPTAFWDLD